MQNRRHGSCWCLDRRVLPMDAQLPFAFMAGYFPEICQRSCLAALVSVRLCVCVCVCVRVCLIQLQMLNAKAPSKNAV